MGDNQSPKSTKKKKNFPRHERVMIKAKQCRRINWHTTPRSIASHPINVNKEIIPLEQNPKWGKRNNIKHHK